MWRRGITTSAFQIAPLVANPTRGAHVSMFDALGSALACNDLCGVCLYWGATCATSAVALTRRLARLREVAALDSRQSPLTR